MKFKVLNVHKDDGTLYVSGCYSPEEGEEETLNTLREGLLVANQTVDGKQMQERFVANDKTILFKSIPIETLYAILQFQNSSFNLHLRVVMGRNMKTNSLRPEIEQYFTEHKL